MFRCLFIYDVVNKYAGMRTWRVYLYSLAVWRLKPILSAGLRFYSHLSGGLRLRNYPAVSGNHKLSSRFSVFVCFCGGYSNGVKADFQSVLRTLESLFTTFVLFHVRRHKM